MDYKLLSKNLVLRFLSICVGCIMITPIFAEDNCIVSEEATSFETCKDQVNCVVSEELTSFEECKDKVTEATGDRISMFDVPEYYTLADPSFNGGEEIQDYMVVGEIQVILHTIEEVQCPEKIKVIGELKQLTLEEEQAWIISVTGVECLE
ncbi:MAG: hypothetical protein KAH84_01380 [Thiomargarita sp.]|nr:hypothetical protein [Thiomargarita sp.]